MILASISERRRPHNWGWPTHATNPILDLARDSWDDDSFGTAMGWLFAIAEHLEFTLHENAPAEWGYSPSPFGPSVTGSYEWEELHLLQIHVAAETRGDDALWLSYVDHAGRVLNRIIDMARLTGTDY